MNRDAKLMIITRAVHETIRAYQAALGETEAPSWDESGWMQGSTREAVEFALRNPTPGAQHESWCESKRREGWRRGPVKDRTLKTHPSLAPFDELAETERRKDALIIAVVQALARALEL